MVKYWVSFNGVVVPFDDVIVGNWEKFNKTIKRECYKDKVVIWVEK